MISITYTAGTLGWTTGRIKVTIPAGWSSPTLSINTPGYFTASCSGGVITNTGISGNDIILDISGLAANTGIVNIVYGDTRFGGGAYVDGPGTSDITVAVSENSINTLPIQSQPQVTVIAATMTPTTTSTVFIGEGSITVNPQELTDNSSGNTLVFVYTAGKSSWSNGTIRISLPSGWSQPNHNDPTSAGFYNVTSTASGWNWAGAGNDIVVGVTDLQALIGTITITYGDKSYGPGAYVTGTGTIKLTTMTDIQSSIVHEIANSPYVSISAPTATVTLTPSLTATLTFTPTITLTQTDSVTETITQTPTITETWSMTFTLTVSLTETVTPTITETSSITQTYTFTQTPTITVTFTLTSTPTPFWDILGGKSFSDGTADFITLSAYNGDAYVGYEDNAYTNRATVLKYSGSSWSPVGAKGFSTGLTNDCSLGVNGQPYLAYRDYDNGNRATVMGYNGSWSVVGGAPVSTGAAYDLSLSTDGIKTFVSYTDNSNGGRATCRVWFGSVWSNMGSPGFSSGTASSLSMDTSSGTPYVAFKEWGYDNSIQKLSVMMHNGVSWVYVGPQGFSPGAAEHISFKIGGSPAMPHVAYMDVANGNRLTVKRFNGSTWDTLGTEGFSAGDATSISLFFNAAGVPSVAFADSGRGGRACVMEYNGYSWDLFAILSDGAANYVSAAFSGGEPYVAFKDIANGGGVTVMRYSGAY
jgi:hypothetical protein